LTADDITDVIAMTTFTSFSVHSQCMLCILAQHCKSRSAVSQSDWQKWAHISWWRINKSSIT